MARQWEHGSTYGFKSGCRCELCSNAKAEDWQRYRDEYYEPEVKPTGMLPRIEAPKHKRNSHPNEGPCSLEGCDSQAGRRGWCHSHYRTWRVYGNPLTVLHGRRYRRVVPRRKLVGDNPDGRTCSKCGEFKAWAFFHLTSGPRGRSSRCMACLQETQDESDQKALDAIPIEDVVNLLGIEPPTMPLDPELERALREQYSDMNTGNFCPPEMFQAMSLDQEVASGLPFTEFMDFDDEPFTGHFIHTGNRPHGGPLD